jgi:dTDP-L-rhamnose 4-epimerase
MKILVTGGAGFIGSHTADALLNSGYRVRILDNLHKTIHPMGKPVYMHPSFEFICGDVRDKDILKQALKGIDAVYHLAAYQDYLTDFSTFFHVNAVSTALLYEILVEAGSRIQKVIVASSQAVMGEGGYFCPGCDPKAQQPVYPAIRLEKQLSEGKWDHLCLECGEKLKWLPSDETVANPCNQYALSKHSQEQIAIQLGKRYDIPTVVMRYSIVQGPRQSLYNAYSGAMRIFSLALMLGRRPMIFEDGEQVRDFVNIQDVVAANLQVLEKEAANDQVFNVGGGKAWTVREFYETLQETVGIRKEPIEGRFYRFGDTRHIFSDTEKLQSLGWKPRNDIQKSIRDYWEFINSAGQVDKVLEAAEEQMKKMQVIREVGRDRSQKTEV